jgi:hypothetical protein
VRGKWAKNALTRIMKLKSLGMIGNWNQEGDIKNQKVRYRPYRNHKSLSAAKERLSKGKPLSVVFLKDDTIGMVYKECNVLLLERKEFDSEKCGAAYFKWRRSGKLVDYHSASSLKENVHMSGILLPRMTPTGAFKRGANRAYACVTSTWMDLLKDGTFGAPMGYSSEIGEYKYER